MSGSGGFGLLWAEGHSYGGSARPKWQAGLAALPYRLVQDLPPMRCLRTARGGPSTLADATNARKLLNCGACVSYRVPGRIPNHGQRYEVMDIVDYGFYTLQCKFRDSKGAARFPALPFAGYMHVPCARRDPIGITQWTLEDPPIFENHHFHWLFIRADELGHYYIINRRSGLCLMVPHKEGAQQLRQDYYSPDHDLEFRFVLEPVPATTSSCKLVCYFSGNPLLIDCAKPDNGQRILAYPDVKIGDIANLGHVEFELTKVGSAKRIPAEYEEKSRGSGAVRQLPQLASLDQYLPPSFPDRHDAPVIDHEILPFLMINDPGLAPYRQIEVSPYYTLRHYQRWDKVLDRQFDGQTKRETTETIVVGMTQLDAYSFKSTFKWSAEATAQAGYKAGGFSGSLKLTAKIEKDVENTREQSTERRESRTRTEEVTYPNLRFPYRIVTWVPADVYELCRTDEQQIICTWTVTREGEDVTYFFPETPIQISQTRSVTAADQLATITGG